MQRDTYYSQKLSSNVHQGFNFEPAVKAKHLEQRHRVNTQYDILLKKHLSAEKQSKVEGSMGRHLEEGTIYDHADVKSSGNQDQKTLQNQQANALIQY